jgi:predicted NBD/HSP70 family sugar kinase
VPFRIGNDANMAAYGEFAHGAGRGARSLVLLTIGTGIGSGIILDGKLWEGEGGYAGEIGHITVNPEGDACKCGGRGCLETEASGPRIVKNYQALMGRADVADSRDVYLLAKAGDPVAIESFKKCAYYLGIGLGIVINLLNPEKILIGGGVVSAGKFLLGPAETPAVPPHFLRRLPHRESVPGQRRRPRRRGRLGPSQGGEPEMRALSCGGPLVTFRPRRELIILTSPEEKNIKDWWRPRPRRPL